MTRSCFTAILLITVLLVLPTLSLAEPAVRIGVQTSLTGDAATFGTDITHALNFANDYFFKGQYRFIVEDDRCTAKDSLAVAHKLADSDKVSYVLGLACNEALLAAAPVYQKAGVIVIAPFATTGDVLDVGDHIFRAFPADNLAAELIQSYGAPRHKSFAVYTEQTEYPVMMQRAFLRKNQEAGNPLAVYTESWNPGSYDHRTTLLKLLAKKPDAIFVNANAEASFIEVVRQLRTLKFPGQIYSAYWAASDTTIKALGSMDDGIIVANTPLLEAILNNEGRAVMTEFVKRYGQPVSINLGVVITIESLRILDRALSSGKDPLKCLFTEQFPGLLGPLSFDRHGVVQGIELEMQKIVNGKVVALR